MLLNNSKSIASVTPGSSSPTYKLAEGAAPAADEDAPPEAWPAESSPEGGGDSLGEGGELLSSTGWDSSWTDSGAAVVVTRGTLLVASSITGGGAVSLAWALAGEDIMNDAAWIDDDERFGVLNCFWGFFF